MKGKKKRTKKMGEIWKEGKLQINRMKEEENEREYRINMKEIYQKRRNVKKQNRLWKMNEINKEEEELQRNKMKMEWKRIGSAKIE